MRPPQTAKQREFESRVKEYGATLARQQGIEPARLFHDCGGDGGGLRRQ